MWKYCCDLVWFGLAIILYYWNSNNSSLTFISPPLVKMVVKQYIMYCMPISMPSFLLGWRAIHRRLISPISTLWDWRHRRKWWMWSLWDDALALLRNRNGFVFLVYSTAKTTGSWLFFLRTRSASEILMWLWTSLSLCNQFWGGDHHCCSWLPTALFH